MSNFNRDRFIKKKSREPGAEELVGPLASTHALAFEYNMNHLRRGRTIIFNHNVCSNFEFMFLKVVGLVDS